jgi:hypothetical protein
VNEPRGPARDDPAPWRLEPDAHDAAGLPAPAAPPVSVVPPRRRLERTKRRGRKVLVLFLLANLLPAAAAVWWFTRPPETRQRLLDSIPDGVGTRAAFAGVAFALLLVLALAVLPGARAAGAALARAEGWFRRRRPVVRILLFPLEVLVALLWFLTQCLFAIDAVAIIACAAAFLLYVVRILKPDLFTWLPG